MGTLDAIDKTFSLAKVVIEAGSSEKLMETMTISQLTAYVAGGLAAHITMQLHQLVNPASETKAT